jgi:hypothetical protein
MKRHSKLYLKRTPLRKRSKSERSKLINDCDDLFRKILLRRDRVCQYSGDDKNLQVSHYITRDNLHLRWDFDNCHIINGGYHIFLFHKRHHIYREWLCERLGKEKVEWLEMQDRINCRPLYTCEVELKKEELKRIWG